MVAPLALRKKMRRWARAWAVLALMALALVAPGAGAQPATSYGRPADQPHGAEHGLVLPPVPSGYAVLDHGWMKVAYPPGARERVQSLVSAADAVRAELSVRLGQPVLAEVHVRIARTPEDMTHLAPEGVPYPSYADGVAYSSIGLVLLTLQPQRPSETHDLAEVFRHELAHVALDDAVGDSQRVPHWFNEGLAVHLSRESPLLRMKTLSTATLAGRLIPLARLERGFPSDAVAAELAYAESADVVRFLLRQEHSSRFPALIRRVRDGQPFAVALDDAYGIDLTSLEYEWREDVAKRYSFWPVFLSGSLVWVGVLVLFALGWRKRRQRSQATLESWAREEAIAELRRAAIAAGQPTRLRIVLPAKEPPAVAPAEPQELTPPIPVVLPVDAEVPKVQHDGDWHTLH